MIEGIIVRTIEWMSKQHIMKDKNNSKIEQYRMNDI